MSGSKFKRVVRERMKRTGESYTRAREALQDPDAYAAEKEKQAALRKRT